MSSSARLKYKIVHCTSEDPEYPVSELLAHSSQTKGWQTARFCEYPQELGLQFETPVHLRQVQFLSHQSKIATKIELFTAMPAEGQQNTRYESAQFKRLGYLSLDSNERSQFQARELKSVYVDVSAQFLRIVLHKCHVNRYNIVNQVGLIALHCSGEVLGPDLAVGPPPPNPTLARAAAPPAAVQPSVVAALPAEPQPQQQPPAAQPQHHGLAPRGGAAPAAAPQPARPAVAPAAAPSRPAVAGVGGGVGGGAAVPLNPAVAAELEQQAAEEAEDEMRYDTRTLERIRSLSAAKQRAVEAEDYEEAKRCKEMLSRLRQTGLLIRELEDRKRAAVQHEDYDAAKALKVEIDRLRGSIDRPGGPDQRGGGPEWQQTEASGSRSPDYASAPPQQTQPRRGGTGASAHSKQSMMSQQHPPSMMGAPGGIGGDPNDFDGGVGDPNDFDGGVGPHGGATRHTPVGSSRGKAAPAMHGGPPVPMVAAEAARGPLGSPPAQSARERMAMGMQPQAAGARGGRAPLGPGDIDDGEAEPRHDDAGRGEPSEAAIYLRGVPNVEDLSSPEPLSAQVEKEAGLPLHLFGDYITRCIYSKSWNLRDAALQKLALDLRDGAYDAGSDPHQSLQGYATILRRSVPDKNVQVFLSSASVLQAVCQQLLGGGGAAPQLRRNEAQAAIDPLLHGLVDRLGDTNVRVEKTARDALLDFARCPTLGAQFTTQYLLKPPQKKTVHARVYSSRLQALTALVTEFGVLPDSRDGVPLEAAVQLAMDWFNNPTAEVREHAVRLVAACYVHVATDVPHPENDRLRKAPRIEGYLAHLRPAQRVVFEAEFERALMGGGVSPTNQQAALGGGMPANRAPQQAGGRHYAAPPPLADDGYGNVGYGGYGGGGLPSPQVAPPRRSPSGAGGGAGAPTAMVAPHPVVEEYSATGADEELDDEVGEFTCQFCGRQDPTFTPEVLDVHYWRECPMLTQCEFCQQVIEIATLCSHLAEECESGAPARAAAREMLPSQCPLCQADVGAAEEADWRHHLLAIGCPCNPRGPQVRAAQPHRGY